MTDHISIIVQAPEAEDEKGIFSSDNPEFKKLPVDVLREQLAKETDKLLSIFDALPSKNGWKLNEVEVGAEISAEGGVSFIGTATIQGNASIKLKFVR